MIVPFCTQVSTLLDTTEETTKNLRLTTSSSQYYSVMGFSLTDIQPFIFILFYLFTFFFSFILDAFLHWIYYSCEVNQFQLFVYTQHPGLNQIKIKFVLMALATILHDHSILLWLTIVSLNANRIFIYPLHELVMC